MELSGKRFLVTGAAGGLGSALVSALTGAGAAKVYAADINFTDSEQGVVTNTHLDITDAASVAALSERFTDADVLINNAAVCTWHGFLIEADSHHARREMEVNYFGTMAMCQAFAPQFVTRGHGRIVNVLSVVSLVNFAGCGSYSASKAALWSMSQAMRAELADTPVEVTCIFPGRVDTAFGVPYWAADDPSPAEPPPQSSPEQIAAEMLEALASDRTDHLAGEDARTDGAELQADYRAVQRRFASGLPSFRRLHGSTP
jgi:NAD(P)-dependent dehydrogenase (short-subunit alcohol dehydrogenase family)